MVTPHVTQTRATPLTDLQQRIGVWQRKSVEQAWSALQIPLEEDKRVWHDTSPSPTFTEAQKQAIVSPLRRFAVGEKQVAENLTPLVNYFRARGRHIEADFIEYSFQREERVHQEFFERYFREVIGCEAGDTTDPHSAHFNRLFKDKLDRALKRLDNLPIDASIRPLVAAYCCYMMVSEGTIAETAYYGFAKALTFPNGTPMLPGLLEGFARIKGDESRHIAFGVYALRECRQIGGGYTQVQIIRELFNLLPDILKIVSIAHSEFKPYPFPNLGRLDLIAEAFSQFSARVLTIFWDRETLSKRILSKARTYVLKQLGHKKPGEAIEALAG